jgi:hypothetical protein
MIIISGAGEIGIGTGREFLMMTILFCISVPVSKLVKATELSGYRAILMHYQQLFNILLI